MMEGEVEQRLQERIVEIVRRLQSQLHSSFRETRIQQENTEDAPSSSRAAAKRPVEPQNVTSTAQDDPLFPMSNFDILDPNDIEDLDHFFFDNHLDFEPGSFSGMGTDSGYGSKDLNFFPEKGPFSG